MLSATRVKSSAQASLEEWERLKLRVQNIDRQLQLELQPHKEKYERTIDPLIAARNEKAKRLEERLGALESEIVSSLKAGISVNGEQIAVARVETAGAVAEVRDNAERQIEPEEFFRAIPSADRDEKFWTCLKVLIGRAEKYLSEPLMQRLARTAHKFSVQVRLKQ